MPDRCRITVKDSIARTQRANRGRCPLSTSYLLAPWLLLQLQPYRSQSTGWGASQPGAVIKVVPATWDSRGYSPTATFARSKRCWLSQVRSARHRPRLADTSGDPSGSCLAAGTVTRSDRPSAEAGIFNNAANLRRKSKVTGLFPFSIWLRCCWVIPTETATSAWLQPTASRYSRLVGPASSPASATPPCLGRSHCPVIRHHQLRSTRSVSRRGDIHRQHPSCVRAFERTPRADARADGRDAPVP
jgi:hypothetical protein